MLTQSKQMIALVQQRQPDRSLDNARRTGQMLGYVLMGILGFVIVLKGLKSRGGGR